MKEIFLSFILFVAIAMSANADTVTHIYDRAPATVPVVDVNEKELAPLNETKGYNQFLVVLGFAGVITVVGGFAYLLTKKK